MKRILFTLITFVLFIFTTGCSITPKYRITIDAITAENASIAPSSYEIKAFDDKNDSEGLIFQNFSEKLAQTLKQKGYIQLSEGNPAKQQIYFDYGLEKVNEETESYSEPDISFNIGWGHPFGGYYGHHYSPFYYNDYYAGGYTTYQKTHVYYNRYVTLLAKDQFNKELWRVDVSSVGESKNLKRIIPILIEAAAPHIGTNTAEPIEIVIKDKPKKK